MLQRRLIKTMFLAVLAIALAVPGLADDYYSDVIEVMQYEATTYMSGGYGSDERKALRKMGRKFSLKLVFAAKNGDYLSAIKVTIKDKRGETWLDAVSEGPWFYVKLPRGKYQIQAAYKDRVIKKTATVNPPKQKKLSYYW
jgi:hypothetical protein